MTKIKSKLLIGFILFTVLFFTFFPTQVLAQSDKSFIFDDNVIFDSDITAFNDSFNLRNSSEYTGIYNASYSFINEVGLNDIDIDFIDSATVDTDTTASIISQLDGHSEILEIYDNDATNVVIIKNNFLNQSNGIIEFWIRTTDITKESYIRLYENDLGIIAINLGIIGSQIKEFSSGSWNDIVAILNNEWYHISVDFDCTTDIYDIYVNGIIYNNKPFRNNVDFINQMYIASKFADSNYFTYYDAIGYSWIDISNAIEVFDFTDDIVGNTPIGWTINDFQNASSTIIASLDGRTNVVELRDDGFLAFAQITHPLLPFDDFVSLEIAKSPIGNFNNASIHLFEGGTEIIRLQESAGNLTYFDGTIFQTLIDGYLTENIFSVIQILTNNDTNQFGIIVDSTFIQGNIPYLNNPTNRINQIRLSTGLIPFNFSIFFDNIFYGNNYSVGSNIIPFLNVSQILQEVDRYEFALKSPTVFNQQQSDNPNGWTDVELLAGDLVNVDTEVDGSFDNFVLTITDLENDQRGLRKQNIGIEGKFINVSLGIVFIQMDTDTTDVFLFNIISSDNTTVAQVRVANRSVFLIGGNGQVDTGIDITAGTGTFVRNEFNMFINYEIDQVFFLLIINESVIGYFNEPLIQDGKEGLNQVDILITSFEVGVNIGIVIDFIGLYSNGISQVGNNDFGVIEVDLNRDTWNFKNNNLVSIEANGTIHLAVINNSYSYNHVEYDILDTSVYQNELKTINIYDSINITESNNPTLLITIIGRFLEIFSAKIDGVVLNESSNSYNLIFEHGNVDTNESFFSVIGSELQFTHIANDTDLEFIQARFNINDTSSDGLLVSFKSVISNNAFGFLRINFTDTSNLIEMTNVERITRLFLTQNLTVRDIVILITDRDINSITGTTIGSISQIKLLVSANITVSVLITSLIAMMIPLIMILIPSLGISKIYGKMLIIPLFLLMSIICLASSLIPVWLFFIIGLSSAVFLLKRDRVMIR